MGCLQVIVISWPGSILTCKSSFSCVVWMILHCDWPVELLRGLEGWASISESAWHTNQAEFPMGTTEVNFLFWSFWSRSNKWIWGVTHETKNAQEWITGWNLSNPSLACLKLFFLKFLNLCNGTDLACFESSFLFCSNCRVFKSLCLSYSGHATAISDF